MPRTPKPDEPPAAPKVAWRRLRAFEAWFDRVTPARIILGLIVVLVMAAHGLFPHRFTVDDTTLGLLAILVVIVLVPLLSKASLPGGGGLEFKQELDELSRESGLAVEAETERRSAEPPVGSPEERVGRPTVAVGPTVDPVPAVVEVLAEAARSPKVGLLLLSTELERAVRTLLLSSGWGLDRRLSSLRQGVDRLVELGVLTASAASALRLFSQIRNEIVHGVRTASDSEVLRAVDAGLSLLRAIQAIPHEVNVVKHPGVTVYSDPAATVVLEGVKGLILETTSPSGLEVSQRVFPTTRDDYIAGRRVAWEWSDRTWPSAWYREPDTDEVTDGWQASMEFSGRMLEP